jgi:Uma2 family endonuclease
MVTQRAYQWYSLEEYHKMEEENPDYKFEYINGQVYAIAGGSSEHSRIAVNMVSALNFHLRGKSCLPFNSDMKVLPQGDEDPSYYPDVTVTCNPEDYQRGSKAIRSPRLIIEVLSPTTYTRDRSEKMYDYQACSSLQEYMLISTHHQEIEVHHQESEDKWELTRYRHGHTVILASVELSISVSDIYDGTTVPALASLTDRDYW